MNGKAARTIRNVAVERCNNVPLKKMRPYWIKHSPTRRQFFKPYNRYKKPLIKLWHELPWTKRIREKEHA